MRSPAVSPSYSLPCADYRRRLLVACPAAAHLTTRPGPEQVARRRAVKPHRPVADALSARTTEQRGAHDPPGPVRCRNRRRRDSSNIQVEWGLMSASEARAAL